MHVMNFGTLFLYVVRQCSICILCKIFTMFKICYRWFTVSHMGLWVKQSKLVAAKLAIEINKATSSAMDFVLYDGADVEQFYTNNTLTWMKPEHTTWDTDGHVHIHSVTKTQIGLNWDVWTKLDYGNHKYEAMIGDYFRVGETRFLAKLKGKFSSGHNFW